MTVYLNISLKPLMLSSQKSPKRVSLSYRQTKILPMSMCLPKELTFNANLKLNST